MSTLPDLPPLERDGEELRVSARDLHAYMQVGRDFSTWIKDRLAEMGAVLGQDYSPFPGKSTGGRPSVEYALSLDTAKHLAMLERTPLGRAARQHFIDAEKALRAAPLALPQSFSEALQLAANIEREREQLAARLQEAAPKVEAFDALVSSTGLLTVRQAAKALGTGDVTLYRELRARRVLMDEHRNGVQNHNLPYQQHLDAGRFEVKVRPFRAGGVDRVASTTFVTPKGLTWLRELLAVPHVPTEPHSVQPPVFPA